MWADTSGTNRANLGAVITNSNVVIIDTGMYYTIAESIKEFIIPNLGSKTSHVLFTHSHANHVFGA